MFDGGVVSELGDERAVSYELEWQAVHRTLCEWAKERAQLDAAGGTYLLEAEELYVFKRLGYPTMAEYMVGELDFTRHAANERLRVSRELLVLPKLAAAYSEGELCFSKVRELTRVVTPETEGAFLVEAAGKDSHQVARMISGLKRGDGPDARPDPVLVTRRVGFELHAEALALLAERKAALAKALGRAPTDDELMIELCAGTVAQLSESRTGDQLHGPTGDGEEEPVASAEQGTCKVPPPRGRQLFVTCKHCARSELLVDGEALLLDDKTAARLACDVELVGDADTNELTRVSSKIPSALRRKVFMRDKFCCMVPGCRAREFLDVHHIMHREHGGAHAMTNLCLLCFQHHKAHHDGKLAIEGLAPHGLTFRWSHVGSDDGGDDSSPSTCGVPLVPCRAPGEAHVLE
jgi:hypothetical protein